MKSKTESKVKESNGGDDKHFALALCDLLKEHNGINVVLLDLRQLAMWTDFFIIATVTSNAHLGGLERHIKTFAQENKLTINRLHKKAAVGDEWHLADLGNIVVHLMSEKARAFYELENLWSGGTRI
ncbi:MAG: ribosome silencing factor [Spirochaetaceae bacterium]|jgi:ribosome-associated protein|nr:ribosome silencing factor [Spirochaetaceae bacterium]